MSEWRAAKFEYSCMAYCLSKMEYILPDADQIFNNELARHTFGRTRKIKISEDGDATDLDITSLDGGISKKLLTGRDGGCTKQSVEVNCDSSLSSDNTADRREAAQGSILI